MTSKLSIGKIERPSAGRGKSVLAQVGGPRDPQVVEIAKVSTNPLNPAWRQLTEGDDFERLVASIGAEGVMVPLLVVSAELWRAAHPQEANQLDEGAEYVALDGNRRVVAARTAGRTEVMAVVRDDAGADASVMLHVNGARAALTPIDEAKAYSTIVAQGKTQTQIAKNLGISQPVIAKRIQLLRLPESLQVLVADRGISVNDALELLKYDEQDLEEGAILFAERLAAHVAENVPEWMRPTPAGCIDDARRAREQRNAESEARAAAENSEQISYIDQPMSVVGERWWDAILPDEKAIRKATKAGQKLIVGAERGEVRYYLHPDELPTPSRPQKSETNSEDKNKKAATKHRADAVGKLINHQPSAVELRKLLVRMLLAGQHPDAEVRRTAWRLALQTGLAPSVDGLDAQGREKARYEWQATLETSGDEKLAWLLAVAYHERQLTMPSHGGNPWCSESSHWYYEQLATVGYEPSEFETRKLNNDEEDA